jgi:NarL family two-component system response regulator LiaR
MEKIKVMVATSDACFQEGLCQFITNEDDLTCVAKTINGDDTIKLTDELCPDVVIIDLDIPLHSSSTDIGHAVEVARQIKAAHPSTAILMVSACGYQKSLFASLQAGVAGYLLKKTAPREFISAVRSLCSREAVFDLEAVTQLVGSLAANKGKGMKTMAQLRPREVELLRVAAKGVTNKEIASELGISQRTVQSHLVNIFRKMECGSRTEAVLHALQEGWLSLDDLPCE